MILFQALSSPIMSFPTTAPSAGSSRNSKGQIRWFLFSVAACVFCPKERRQHEGLVLGGQLWASANSGRGCNLSFHFADRGAVIASGYPMFLELGVLGLGLPVDTKIGIGVF